LESLRSIVPFLPAGVFDSNLIESMSMAFNDLCRTLNLPDRLSPAKIVIAERIIDLARTGERNPARLHDLVLKASGFSREGTPGL
jgi:hypothetical protein